MHCGMHIYIYNIKIAILPCPIHKKKYADGYDIIPQLNNYIHMIILSCPTPMEEQNRSDDHYLW